MLYLRYPIFFSSHLEKSFIQIQILSKKSIIKIRALVFILGIYVFTKHHQGFLIKTSKKVYLQSWS